VRKLLSVVLFGVACTPLSAACTCGCAGTGVADSKGPNAGTGVRDRHKTRIKKSELKIIAYSTLCFLYSAFCVLYLMFVGNIKCFGVWPKPNYVNFLEGVLLCPKLISAGFYSVVFL
jgi:hypothetical protein